jgi:nitrite reductase (NADH) large subunit
MRYAVIGNGVAGTTATQEISRRDPSCEVDLFSEEAYPYYRRPLLWAFIAGELEQEGLYYRPASWYAERNINLRLGTAVASIETSEHRITMADGSTEGYDRVLLAMGARPFIPPLEGTGGAGVFALRTMDDALAIRACAREVERAVVIGGGLLGLETARAINTAGASVTVIEFFPHLLPRQLDVEGAAVLQALLEEQGLRIITGGTTEAVLGDGEARGVRLRGGVRVAGELILFSTGIRCRTDLAEEAGIRTNRGIIVDSQLQSSTEDVFAVGDVAEFGGTVYGIIPPAIEQARVAAANMVDPGSASYNGSIPSTTLKVAGAELTTIGDGLAQGEDYVALRHVDLPARHYRKLVLHHGRIVGAILLNDHTRARTIRQLIEGEVDVSASGEQLLDDQFDVKSLLN